MCWLLLLAAAASCQRLEDQARALTYQKGAEEAKNQMNTSPLSSSSSPSLPSPLLDLERCAEPYLHAGYRIVSQTHSSLTLLRPSPPFSTALFIVLLIVFWPAAVIYSVVNRNRRNQMVCLRMTSQGEVEATGDGTMERRREAARRTNQFAIVVTMLLLIAVIGAGWLLVKSNHASIPQGASFDERNQQGSLATAPASFQHSAAPASSSNRFPALRRTAKEAEAPTSTLAAANTLATTSGMATTQPSSPVPSSALHPEPLPNVSEGATLFAFEHTADTVYRRAEVDSAAQIIERPAPAFTIEGVQTSGVVRLQAVLRSSGEVSDITVVKGLPHGLTACAVVAARRIRFRPAMKNGKAVSMHIQLEYSFNAQQ